jgi:hypothetical protein
VDGSGSRLSPMDDFDTCGVETAGFATTVLVSTTKLQNIKYPCACPVDFNGIFFFCHVPFCTY